MEPVSSVMYSSWFDQWIQEQEYLDIDPAPQQAAIILVNYLDTKMSVHEAATKITASFWDEDYKRADVRGLWILLLDAAQELPAAQNQIVVLLAAIKHMPDLEYDDQIICVNGAKVWSELPCLGWEMRDLWNYLDPEPTDPGLHTERQKWRNINAFAARLTTTQTDDYLMYAIWTLREALDDDHKDSLRSLDGAVPAAAQWILRAGRMIHESEWEIQPSFTEGDPLKGDTLWEGKHGFCRQRWMFWKERFHWVTKLDELDRETKDIAMHAMEAMDRIDTLPN